MVCVWPVYRAALPRTDFLCPFISPSTKNPTHLPPYSICTIQADKIRLTPDGDVKVAYTLSGLLAKTLGTKPAEQTVVLTCSPFWLPPEAVTGTSEDEGFCEKSDVWSLGITAIEMATGDPPHVKRKTLMEVLFAIMKGPPPTLEGEGFSDEFKDFVATCLKKDLAMRPTAQVRTWLEGWVNCVVWNLLDSWRVNEPSYCHLNALL